MLLTPSTVLGPKVILLSIFRYKKYWAWLQILHRTLRTILSSTPRVTTSYPFQPTNPLLTLFKMRASFFASLVILATTTAVSAVPIEARNNIPVFSLPKGGNAGSGYSGSVDGGNAINSGYSYVGNSAFASKCCFFAAHSRKL